MNHKLINKVTFSFLFFISSWQYASCQKDFLNGYIINLNGDTVNGFIKYKNTVNNPNEVTFINKLSKEQQTFSPKEIKAYSVKDEFFESANVSTEVGQSDTKEINFDTSLKLTRINVFLQTIIHGNKSLYYYHGKHQNEHFYIKKDSVFELLIYKKYYSKIDDITTEKENKKYINQLYNYLEDCSTIVTKLNNTEYYKSDLEKLFIYYYNEMKTVLSFHKKTDKITTQIGLFAGYTNTSITFSGGGPYYLMYADFKHSSSISGGLYLDIIFPKYKKRWSSHNELMYSSFNINGTSIQNITSGIYTTTNSNFNYSYLKVNTLVRYKIINKTYSLFINAGLSNGFELKGKNYAKSFENMYGSINTTEGEPLTDTKNLEQSILLGIGTTFKKYSLELRSEFGNGMGINTGTITNVTRYSCLLYYKL